MGGAGDALASERRYVRRVLPRAVGAGLAPWRRGRGAGVRTAAMVLLGLGFTAGGYLHGRVVLAAGDGQGRSSAGALPSASAPDPGSTRARSRSSSSRSRSSSSSR